jgi:hypothetical protein
MVAKRDDVELRRCEACGTHWQVDVGRGGLAIRVSAPENWLDFDDLPVRLQHMIDYHGGVDEGRCIWAGCNRRPLKRMKFCPHHAYPELSNEVGKETDRR